MKATFFIPCDTILLVRVQEKFELDHSWKWTGQANQDGDGNVRNQEKCVSVFLMCLKLTEMPSLFAEFSLPSSSLNTGETMVINFWKWSPRPDNNFKKKISISRRTGEHDDLEIMPISHIHVLLCFQFCNCFYCFTEDCLASLCSSSLYHFFSSITNSLFFCVIHITHTNLVDKIMGVMRTAWAKKRDSVSTRPTLHGRHASIVKGKRASFANNISVFRWIVWWW